MRYVIIKAGIVENVVEWDGKSDWAPPADTSMRIFDGVVSPGWLWNDGNPVDPAPLVQVVEAKVQQIAALRPSVQDAIDALVRKDAGDEGPWKAYVKAYLAADVEIAKLG